MDYLKLQNLSIWYDKYHAVKDLSLSIAQGELFTFLGPSGSGKSTILLCTAGFLRPRSGKVFLQNEDITQVPANLRGIGMVFQSYALFPHKTVFENMAYPLRVRKLPRKEIHTRVSETAELVGLKGLEDRMPNQLSGGQQQRVALARALVFNPRLLLLDEPLGALDKKLREQMKYEVRRIQRTYNSTVLYVTHDQNEAMSISDRLGVLRDGQIEQVGTPREVYENPASLFVADFIGGANFIDVTVKSLENTTCTVAWHDNTMRGVPKPNWLSASGDSLVMMVRPEHICASEDNSKPEESIPCRIIENTYLGEMQHLQCKLQDGLVVNARERSSKDVFHHPGQEAFLRFDITKTRLFKAKDSRN